MRRLTSSLLLGVAAAGVTAAALTGAPGPSAPPEIQAAQQAPPPGTPQPAGRIATTLITATRTR